MTGLYYITKEYISPQIYIYDSSMVCPDEPGPVLGMQLEIHLNVRRAEKSTEEIEWSECGLADTMK